MKKSVIIFVMLFAMVVSIVLSCKRLTVPVPSASCPQIALSSIAGSDSQTVFMNSPISPITYGITFDAVGDTTNFTVTGLPLGITGYYSGGVFSITGTPTTTLGSPFTYTVNPIGSACQGISVVTGRIVVDTCAAINLSSAAGTDSQTVSVNVPLTAITYSTSGTSNVTVSGLPAGVIGSFSGSTFTISGTPTTTAGSPFPYTLITTSSSCSAPTTGIITVTP
ncbi:MAG TPA: hypothetical protein VK718_12465 [Ferruginibacter sp.]|jgi:hypothetical protein|nr:hypothetical protein [Ferruginibacter sp.]